MWKRFDEVFHPALQCSKAYTVHIAGGVSLREQPQPTAIIDVATFWSTELRENLQSQRPWFMPFFFDWSCSSQTNLSSKHVSLTDQSLGFIMFCFYPLTYPRQRAIRRFQFLLTLHFKGRRWQVCLGVSDWWKPTRHITVDDTPAANVTIGHPWTPWTSLT